MAYKFKKTKKTITVGKNPGEKYVLAMASDGKVDTDMLCKYIERNSSISEQDIKILMRALADVISENIELGRGVNLEDLGTFLPNIHSTGSDTVEEVSANNIEKVVINFRPATRFRKEMENSSVKEATKYNLKHE